MLLTTILYARLYNLETLINFKLIQKKKRDNIFWFFVHLLSFFSKMQTFWYKQLKKKTKPFLFQTKNHKRANKYIAHFFDTFFVRTTYTFVIILCFACKQKEKQNNQTTLLRLTCKHILIFLYTLCKHCSHTS